MGLGYYSPIRNLRSQVQEMSQARCTGDRPLIIVTEDHENLPTIDLTVQNVGSGPANITRPRLLRRLSFDRLLGLELRFGNSAAQPRQRGSGLVHQLRYDLGGSLSVF